MSVIASVPKLISTKILMTLQNELIAKKICTAETNTEIKKLGDKVTFVGLARPTISAYTGTITYEGLTDASVDLEINQANSYAFKIEDIDAFQSAIDLKGGTVAEAGYGLLNTADQYVFGLHAGAGKTITATVSETIATSTTTKVQRLLEEVNVRSGNSWLVIPPWYKEKLRLAGIKFQVMMNGDTATDISWVNYDGMDIYVSNNLAQTGSDGSYVTQCLAGSYNSIVYAEQILKSRYKEELENSFAGGASGLHVFGARVIKPSEVIRITATQAADSTAI